MLVVVWPAVAAGASRKQLTHGSSTPPSGKAVAVTVTSHLPAGTVMVWKTVEGSSVR
jgi:hypothetical protein